MKIQASVASLLLLCRFSGAFVASPPKILLDSLRSLRKDDNDWQVTVSSHANAVKIASARGSVLFAKQSRSQDAFDTRVAAAEIARGRGVTPSVANGDELRFRNPATGKPSHIASFTKGLPHLDTSQIKDPAHFAAFVKAVDSGDELVIANLALGPERDSNGKPKWRSHLAKQNNVEVRGWESMAAGLAFDLQGPDAQSVAIPPAPCLTSSEFIAEAAEVYLMALNRDLPFSSWTPANPDIKFAIDQLNDLDWFKNPAQVGDTPEEIRRRRGPVNIGNLFRGITPGSDVGPLLSQFLIAGSDQLGTVNDVDEENGIIGYGSITIDQRVRIATECKDYLIDMDEFLDAQDGADFRRMETYEPGKRLIKNMRDLATWVHYDALYEAYLNACLILLANEVPMDPNLPFQAKDKYDKHQNFVNFGGPHILSLVTEVATRALKAVRYQKFNVHRRLRPEALGGLINAHKNAKGSDVPFPEIEELVQELDAILIKVKQHNEAQVNKHKNKKCKHNNKDSFLLPMAFPEGSPMHPSYGAGHATVAGACVTILKAFFDSNHVLEKVFDEEFEVDDEGIETSKLRELTGTSKPSLTVGGELNKLAENVAIGRNMAGVHWFTDSFESLLLGEEIAIGILEEQKLTYGENFAFSLDKFDGTTIRI